METLSILSILISRFPLHLSGSNFDPQPLTVLAPLLSHPRPVVRKRAIITLSQFIPISQPELFSSLLNSNVFPFLDSSANLDKQRTTVHLVAAVARHSPLQIAPVLNQIMPGILKAVQRDDEELREGCLQVCSVSIAIFTHNTKWFHQALEALLLRCPTEITQYLGAIVQVGNQYIKYDPVSSCFAAFGATDCIQELCR